MDFQDAMRVLASGMSAQRLRMNLLSSNLANANTTESMDGGPYKRRDAIFQSQNPLDTFENILTDMEEDNVRGVSVSRINKSDKVRKVFDPSHPQADGKGYVSMPDINVIEEMVDLLQTTRTYEANAQAAKALKAMASQALNIGN